MTNINIFTYTNIHVLYTYMYALYLLPFIYSWDLDLDLPFTWPSAHHHPSPFKNSSLLHTSSSTTVPTAGGPLNGPVYTGIFTSLLLHSAQGISHKPTPSTLPSTKQAQVNYRDNPSSLILYLHNYNIQYTNTQPDQIQSNYVSTYTKVHHIHTAIYLQQEILNFKYWMNLQVEVKVPSVFAVLFDEDALCIYNKIFSMITKVCPCTIYYMYSVLYRMTYTCLLCTNCNYTCITHHVYTGAISLTFI